MNDDYNFGQPFSAGPQFGMQGSAAEIESILERVKDERLRLIRLLKDCETRFGTTGVVPPAEEIARLTGKVRAIDEAVRNRYTQLRHDESLVEKRANQIDQLHDCVKGLADQVDGQITNAKGIEPDIAAARQSVQNQTDQVLHQARGQVAQIGQTMADRIEEYRHTSSAGQEQLRESRREIEKVFKDIDDRLAAAAGLARDEAQKLIDPIFAQLENHATECGQRIQQLVVSTDEVVRDRLEALPGKAHEVLQPTRESLDGVIEDARHQVANVNDALQSLDNRVHELSEKTEGLVTQQLGELSERAGQALDAMIAERITDQQAAMDRQQTAFHERMQQQQDQFAQHMQEQENALKLREQEAAGMLSSLMMDKQAELIVTLDEQMASQTQRLLPLQQNKIEQLVTETVETASADLTKRIEAVTSDADGRGDAIAQQIKDRLAASLDQTRAEAEGAVGAIEEKARLDKDRLLASLDQHKSGVLESLDHIKDQARSVSEKAERQASQVGEEIERTLREQVVGAMSRAEALTDPFKSRLHDALAEHRRLADEYSHTAETELTEKAKAHWDAFRQAAQAALDKQKQELDHEAQTTIDQTQDKLRQRVQELCTSSQSMVELIEQQLTRRLNSIEPQTNEAIEVVEKQFGDRLGQMRENAESMVQLVEDQLGKRVSELQPKAINAAREAEHELNEHMDRIRLEVENIVAPLRRQAIEELGNIADVGKSVRGVIRQESGAPGIPAGSTDAPVVDARKLTTPLQEMASRMGKKAAKLVGTRNEAEAAAEQSDNPLPDTDSKAA